MGLVLYNSNADNRATFSVYNASNFGQFVLQNNLVIPSAALTGDPYSLIDTIISYIRPFSSSFQNPNFYRYIFDGPVLTTSRFASPYFILDGGSDMFDQGNYTTPWLKANTDFTNLSAITNSGSVGIDYSKTSSTLLDSGFYYASIGYDSGSYPLLAIGARSGSGPIGFQKAGNIGLDGQANTQVSSGSIYSGTSVNGFTTYAWYRQTWGGTAPFQYDPTICDVYILLGHTNWTSSFGLVVSKSVAGTQLQGGALYATGSCSNLLAATMLLSRTGSSPVTQSLPISTSDIQASVDAFVSKVQASISF